MVQQDYNYDMNAGDNSRYISTGLIDGRFRDFYVMSNYKTTPTDELMQSNYTITDETEYRLDKISNLFFETSKLWYAIMIYNRMYDISDYKKGVTINIPSFDVLSNII